jgi:hypothetical protein
MIIILIEFYSYKVREAATGDEFMCILGLRVYSHVYHWAQGIRHKQYIHNFILLPSIVLSFIHNFCYDDLYIHIDLLFYRMLTCGRCSYHTSAY